MKLATEVNFTFHSKICKQIDGYTMGAPLSVMLRDKYVVKMETDVAHPLKPLLYSIYVDDIYNRHKKDEFNEVFYALNNNQENIKLTIELSPSKFFDTQLVNVVGKYITKVHKKENKIPIH